MRGRAVRHGSTRRTLALVLGLGVLLAGSKAVAEGGNLYGVLDAGGGAVSDIGTGSVAMYSPEYTVYSTLGEAISYTETDQTAQRQYRIQTGYWATCADPPVAFDPAVVKLELGNVNAGPGSQVWVPIALAPGSPVTTFGLEALVTYDGNVLGPLLDSDGGVAVRPRQGVYAEAGVPDPLTGISQCVHVAAAVAASAGIAQGLVVEIGFVVNPTAPPDTQTTITIGNASVVGVDGRWHVAASPGMEVRGILTVVGGPALCGDVNGDGKVTVADVVLALRFAVGSAEPTPVQLKAADLNGTGAVELGDVQRLLRVALGLDTCS